MFYCCAIKNYSDFVTELFQQILWIYSWIQREKEKNLWSNHQLIIHDCQNFFNHLWPSLQGFLCYWGHKLRSLAFITPQTISIKFSSFSNTLSLRLSINAYKRKNFNHLPFYFNFRNFRKFSLRQKKLKPF